ncbi:hypothetical protein B0H11DRAFT_2277283 [Mycena galericulata]|nr:hypothetical protein B0H11DRAFT_2277283 [Mycena galericulata]
MPLTDSQRAALLAARKLLDDVGLLNLDSSDDADFQQLSRTISSALPCPPSPVVLGYRYTAPSARDFTLDELARGLNCITRQTYVHGIVEHPVGAIVEYPETGKSCGLAVAHRFAVDPASDFHPKLNIQYSLGDNHGGRRSVNCGPILSGQDGKPASCNNLKIACKGLKVCSARGLASGCTIPAEDSPAKEVFNKTLAFFCTLVEKGCAFDPETDDTEFGSLADSDSDSDSTDSDSESSDVVFRSRQRARDPTCHGQLLFKSDEYGRPFIECEKRSKKSISHLILRNLDEFEIPYLRALLTDNFIVIAQYELSAKAQGYGPLSPCPFTASPSAQKQLCPYWHRSSSGKLNRGILERWKHNCTSTFNIYTPDDLEDCPFVLIICQNPHSHPPPSPVKTPPPLLQIFRSLLLDLDWKLADATPRKIVVESGFMFGLRQHLGWNRPSDPPLSELHPSLGNLDHVRRYIDALRKLLYPEGTGLEGAELLLKEHLQLPEHDQYVRCVETHTLDDGKLFHLVICMFRAMSEHLMRTKMLSLDTAFKRIHGKWEEFEMETWDVKEMRFGTRAFTTSQSAQAHLILFTRIFEIASSDTGIPVQFRHIHGAGMELWIADGHKGQGLGAGMFCQSLCEDSDSFCPIEPSRLLRDLTPADHLRRFYRYCKTHYKRNIDELRPYTTRPVRKAMLSLASSHEHPDLDGALKIIENGGRKAKAWLKDKISGTKFALPALYQPMSLIPLEIWKAAPSTTNGNEQAHRNINRDGVNLTILGGIMRGMQYDARAMAALSLHSSLGIYHRDQTSTHFRRFQRTLNRQVLVQRRVAEKSASEDVSGSTDGIHGPADQPHRSEISPAARRNDEIPLYTTRPLVPSIPTPSSSAESQYREFGYIHSGDYPMPAADDIESHPSALPFIPQDLNWNGSHDDTIASHPLHVPRTSYQDTLVTGQQNGIISSDYPLHPRDLNMYW